MSLTRRELLRLAALAGLAPAVLAACDDDDGSASPGGDAGPTPDMGADPDAGPPDDGLARPEWTGEPGPADLFQHGVASGDPLPDAVVLWSRVTPAEDGPVEVFWEVATAPDFLQRTAVGTAEASEARDYTVKIDATGLAAGTTYYYRFHAQGRVSPIGRTRTAPTGAVSGLRFAVVSCASLAHGYFHAYRHVAERADLDAVIHLGDYIYEYGSGQYGSVRPYEPAHEIITLEDYRVRYRQYRRDADLLALHQQHPIIPIWDDHETANNSWRDGAENHAPATEGAWADRKAAAIQAWYEWLPVRETADHHIFRKLSFGDLLDLIMLDTRIWGREEQLGGASAQMERFNEERTLLGQDQEAWLRDELAASTASWRVIGQQVMMGQLQVIGVPRDEGGGTAVNLDQWDGYVASRDRFFQALADEGVEDVVVLTGDIHTSWAMDLAPDPYDADLYDGATGAGSVGVEFVTPGITSPGLAALVPGLLGVLQDANPHIKWADLSQRGYMTLDVDPARIQGDWFLLTGVDEEAYTEPAFAAAWITRAGENHLVEGDAPAPARADAPALAPV
ncbi:MAG: alkaline phosphatase D family protein [Myxococcales bacterium]|nr:alkaline phosphatase D family protein [Myxococcales bacterium]